MKNCTDCKYADWYRTANGNLHPSGDGKCNYPYKVPALPAAMWWLDTEPTPDGGAINRRKELKDRLLAVANSAAEHTRGMVNAAAVPLRTELIAAADTIAAQAARIAELEAINSGLVDKSNAYLIENARMTERVAELEAEQALRRKSGSASDRLHNLCEGIAADADGSEWSREEWAAVDAEGNRLRAEVSTLQARLAAAEHWAKHAMLMRSTQNVELLGILRGDAVTPAQPTTAEGLTRWALCPETGVPCSSCPTRGVPCQAGIDAARSADTGEAGA
jgi:hypothetical protein